MLEILNRIPADQYSGLIGSSKSFVLAKLAPDLIITASTEQAQRLKEEIEFISGRPVSLFPAVDVFPGEGIEPGKEVAGDRLAVINKWAKGEKFVVVAPLKAVIVKTSRRPHCLTINNNEALDRDRLISSLVDCGYERREIVGERGEFSVRGGIVDIFPANEALPVRFELDYDKVSSLRNFDPQSQRSVGKLGSINLLPTKEKYETSIFEHLPEEAAIVLDEPVALEQIKNKLFEEAAEFHGENNFIPYEEIFKQRPIEFSSFLKPGIENRFEAAPQYFGKLDEFIRELSQRPELEVCIVSKHKSRLTEMTDRTIIEGTLAQGFKADNLLVLTDHELFGEEIRPSRPKKAVREGINEELLADLKDGDYVVHEDYGIGIYRGMKKLEEVEGEHVLIEYAGSDKLYVPLTMLGMIEKFSASEDFKPKLSRLGTAEWSRVKSRVKKSIQDMTKELLELYASRQAAKGFSYQEGTVWEKELEATFPYDETADQLKAIDAVKKDMSSPVPMDRLVCGDVGYGKTEVALRAAAMAVASGKQVALLVPTTILAEQHYNNFKERFKTFPFSVNMLSRFRSQAEQKRVIAALADGGVDLVIGTHRLLSKDIRFKDLGLLIIDEEQRFGVAHKERLKQFKRTVDVLTLSATPIPRTLYFSLSGARELSMISTPPLDRSPIRTYVLSWNEAVVREAILKELDRGGQVYFVFNHVEKIEGMAAKLRRLVPEAKIGIGHGQMKEHQLEETMVKFLRREFNVLLCTTIIESGIDIQSVNTIIIDDADRFGLAQLYQLRGRVGRSAARAYAYLFYHPGAVSTETSIDRLKAIQEFTALGSGYKIAMRDLEIRGAGNLLGAEQHGHMLAVGFDMYCELLEETARELKGVVEPTPRQVEVDLRTEAHIPSDYIEDERQRIAVYRRMNLLDHPSGLAELKEELQDRFGAAPKPLSELFEVIGLKIYAQQKGVRSIKEKEGLVTIEYIGGRKKDLKNTGIAGIRSLI